MPGSFSSLARVPLGATPAAARRSAATKASPHVPPHAPFPPPLDKVGRRSAPRLRLSIPAKLVTVTQTVSCVLLDVSRSGAQVSLPDPLAPEDSCVLRFAACEVFAFVSRRGTGLNGLHFEEPLDDEAVLATRRFAESYEADERAALMASARAWVTGGR